MGKITAAALAVLMLPVGAGALEISPAVQREIDRHVEVIKAWAASDVVVEAVLAQNARGPVAGMDNAKWKSVRRSDARVKAFQAGAAGQYLKQKLAGSDGAYSEAFLNAAQGEKVAFVEKTSSYIHKGQPKFDLPFSGKVWRGKPEFDESSQTHQLQVSVPVLSGGKPVGVLVVGINLSRQEKAMR